MKYRATIVYGDKTFVVIPRQDADDEDLSLEKVADSLQDQITNSETLSLKLEGGGFIILPKGILEKCIFEIQEVSE